MWDAFLHSILTSYLPTCNGFSKTSLFLKIQMSPFFPPIPTEKTGNARCEMSLFAPPLNTHILTGSFHPHSSSEGSHPAICLLGPVSSHTPRCTAETSFSQRMVCLHPFLPGLLTKSSFPRLDQPSWKRILRWKENEYIGKKVQRSPERKIWDADAYAVISKCCNLYTKHVTKHQLMLQ